jgi:putative MFS transporter
MASRPGEPRGHRRAAAARAHRFPRVGALAAEQGTHRGGERVIKKVYGPSFSLRNLPEQPAETKASLGSLLRSGYGTRMLFVAVFWTCSVIPVFAVYAFAPKVLQALNLKGSWASYGSVIITVLFVVGCLIATKLINVLGRRPMLIHSFLWSGLALLGLGLFSSGSQVLVLVLFGAYAVFIGGAQVLQLVYPNELFPTEIRSLAVGTGASLSRVGAAVGTWLVPMSLQSIGIGNTMFAAAAVTLLGLLVSLALAPETRSLSLQEAAALPRRDRKAHGRAAPRADTPLAPSR